MNKILYKSEPKEFCSRWVSEHTIHNSEYIINIKLTTYTFKIHSLTQETINTIKEIIYSSKYASKTLKEDLQKYYDRKHNNIFVYYVFYSTKNKYCILLIEKNGK